MAARIEDLYHIGMVVEDAAFDATCAELSAASGVRWSPLIRTTMDIWTPGGEVRCNFEAVYSVEGPPHYEVVSPVPGTVIMPTAGRPLHHFGYWTDDIVADSAALIAAGNPMVLAYLHEGKPAGFTYHAMPNGLYLELVDRSAYDDWSGFLQGKHAFESKY